ncbi:nucleotide exchange factor GrpE [Pelotomaculum sp. PtaB.Bin117]|uniref:nucleotide exchange factor GrpE n=1 Tax=Pelotomaculum sp. PtaB.Bin117 TaxID=1811694 RepID=UPI0009C6CAD1|nr:nucleotide exchange factor GrpE [Pelotomaculum sp. PtaB.Bin117]OPX87060.1 MAG: heat shock protein GrpE [Pelotomaculum sp. PtaB.Bin117]
MSQDAQEKNNGVRNNEAGAGPVQEVNETELSSLQLQLKEQKVLAEDYYNRLARVQADYDNFRRRTRQEKEDFYKYASEQLMVALLPVLDNFDRALAAEGESVESFKSGVQMIYRQLQDILETNGLKPVAAVGEQFDPARHEAVQQAETDEHPDNTVIEEFLRGYCLKDKIIRPAMVKVAKSS